MNLLPWHDKKIEIAPGLIKWVGIVVVLFALLEIGQCLTAGVVCPKSAFAQEGGRVCKGRDLLNQLNSKIDDLLCERALDAGELSLLIGRDPPLGVNSGQKNFEFHCAATASTLRDLRNRSRRCAEAVSKLVSLEGPVVESGVLYLSRCILRECEEGCDGPAALAEQIAKEWSFLRPRAYDVRGLVEDKVRAILKEG